MDVAILGAAGAIGHSVAEAYHAAGQRVRLVGRRPEALADLKKPDDTVVGADLATEQGCRLALKGVSTAVYSLGLPYLASAFSAYPPMMQCCVAAARAEGVRRLLLITNVYPYGRPQTATVTEEHPRVPCSRKGELRKQQEDILLSANGDGLETISLRLPDFYGPRVASSLMDMVVKAAVAGKTGTLLGPADTLHEFVFTPDVGPVVRALLEYPQPLSGAFNFAGAGVITQTELAELIYHAAGRAPKFRVMAPWLQDVVGLFMPVLRELKEMRYLHETPILLDDTKLLALLPEARKTPYEEGAKAVVMAERQAS